jgi:hypothetical protein
VAAFSPRVIGLTDGRAERAARLVYWLVVALATAAFLTSRYVWLQDVPDWLYQGCIVHAKLLSGSALPQYGWKPYPVPNTLFTLELALLQSVVSPLAAAKLAVAITIAGFGWLLPRATAIFDPRRRYLRALAAFPMLALSSGLWNGFIAYQLGALLLLAYMVLEARESPSVARTSVFGTLIFLAHGVTFMAFVGFVAMRAVATRSRASLAGLVPGFVLTAWYCLGMGLSGGRWEGVALPPPLAHPSVLQLVAWKAYSAFKLGPFQNFILADGRSFLEARPATYYALVGCNIGFISLLVFHGLGMGRASRGDPARRGAWLYGCLVFAAYLPLPFVIFHVVNLGERLLFLGLMAWVVAAPLPRPALAALLGVALLAAVSDGRLLAYSRTQEIPERVERLAPDTGGDFIERSLGRTRLRYFSHKLFEGAPFYRRIAARDYTASCFATGILTDASAPVRSAGLPGPPRRSMVPDTLHVP